MKKNIVVVGAVFCGLLVFSSCMSINTAGLATLEKPIRIGQIFTTVSASAGGGDVLIQRIVELLTKDMDVISNAVKEQTGFPLDFERFFAEAGSGQIDGNNTGVTWSAESPIKLGRSNEAFAQIDPSQRRVWIIKGGSNKNERIYMDFRY